MTINKNVNPFYDDFDETKNYHQILFKPGYPVQARELTQSQSILQNQVAKLGDSIYQQGSIVIPGNSRGDLNVPYVKMESTYNGSDLDLSLFEGNVIVGATSGVKAIVKKALPTQSTDPVTFYIAYTSSGVIADVPNGKAVFDLGENVYVESNPAVLATVLSTNAIGTGSMAYVNRGVYYVNGYFVTVLDQSIVLSKYDSLPTCKVLLQIVESLVDYTEDSSLLDPAQGSYNFAAPGADRYKIELILTTLAYDATVSDNYVEIMRYNAGVLELHSMYPKYSELEKSLARRTYDESGDYVVSGLSGTIRESKKIDNNGGFSTTGSADDFVVSVSPGKVYINGFEVHRLSRANLIQPKARTAAHTKIKTFNSRPEYGRYILISNVLNGPSIKTREIITFKDTSGGGATTIGTARVLGIDYEAGDPALPTCIYKLYVSDVQYTSTVYSAMSLGAITYASGSAYVVQTLTTSLSAGTYNIGDVVSSDAGIRTATVDYWSAATSTLYVHKHTTAETPINGDMIIDASTSATSVIKARQAYFGTAQNTAVFPLPINSLKSLKNAGNTYDNLYYTQKQLSFITNSSGAGSVTIGDGVFETPAAGNFVAVSGNGSVSPSLFTLSGSNNVLNLTGGPVSTTVYVYATVIKTSMAPRTKLLTTITGESHVVGSGVTTLTLNKCDIYRLTSVSISGVDVTNQYLLDNGQTDYGYYKGSISLKTNGAIPSGTVYVSYEYFEHSAGDYFSIDSYSGNTDYLNLFVNYRSSSGTTYNLLTCLDARPTVGSNSDFATGTGAIVGDMLISSELFSSSAQYFVPRYDLLTIDKDATLSIITGTPDENPLIPAIPSGRVALETYYVPAYTRSIASIKKTRNLVDRYTMKGIAKLETRISNLEQFSVLSQSESATVSYDVVDPATGISRFKTGYLVENFTTPFTIANGSRLDFSASFDNKMMSPALERMECDTSVLASSSHYVNKSGLYMLPYTETLFASQPVSSRITNLNPFLMVSWTGVASVTPAIDTWIDIIDLPTVFNDVQSPDINIINWIPAPVEAPTIPSTNLPVTTPSSGGSGFFGGAISGIFGSMGDVVGGVASGVADLAGGIVEGAADIASSIVGGVGDAVGGLVDSVVGCCVVATALSEAGDWTADERDTLSSWATSNLDTSFLGERLHRGYHIVGPNILIPMLKSGGWRRRYIKYTFESATDALRGKKVSILSIPNTLMWVVACTLTGMVVTKQYAKKSWKKLYKNKGNK